MTKFIEPRTFVAIIAAALAISLVVIAAGISPARATSDQPVGAFVSGPRNGAPIWSGTPASRGEDEDVVHKTDVEQAKLGSRRIECIEKDSPDFMALFATSLDVCCLAAIGLPITCNDNGCGNAR
jgi:hypothetical protein